jgi:putative ABC transport system permease protein
MLSLIVAITWIELARPLFESLTGTGVWLRKSLVVFQYSITIVLITGILVVQLQLRFIRDKDLGFNKENLLVMGVNGSIEVIRGYEGFLQEISANPNITGICRSNTGLAFGLANSGATAQDASGKKINSTVYRMRVDHDYIDTYDMKLVAGRNFIKGSASDSARGFIINEATTKVYGYQDPQDMIGKDFLFNGIQGEIIGVVKDFHYTSLQQKIEPTCMYLLNGNFSRISMRINGNIEENVNAITQAWKKYFPGSVLDYTFTEDRVLEQYQSEQRFSKIFLVFSAISLAIACLGLFALVSYSVERRTKEIGIRKVLGASVTSIVHMLSKEFLVLILISCIIAIPVAYYFMQLWLQDFAYRTPIAGEIFVTGGVIALFIAMITVSIKSIRSAMTNPVDSLRSE